MMQNADKRHKSKAIWIIGIIVLLAVVAFAVLWYLDWKEKPKMVDGIKYQIPHQSENAEVVGCDPEAKALVIQKEYKGKLVTIIRSLSFGNSQAQTIEIPDSVTELSWNAFENSAIQSISIPRSVKTIGGKAFKNCSALEEVVFAGFPELGETPFEGCTALKSVVFPVSTNSRPLDLSPYSDCKTLEEIHVPMGYTLDKNSEPPERATLYCTSAEILLDALRRGWPCVGEEGWKLRVVELAEALENSDVKWQLTSDRWGHECGGVTNETEETLILTWTDETSPATVDLDGNHFFYTSSNDDPSDKEYLLLKKGESNWIGADSRGIEYEYYSDYGPGDTTLILAAGSKYAYFEIQKGAQEVAEAVALEPNGHKVLTLPEGRYGIKFSSGDVQEEAREKMDRGEYEQERYEAYSADEKTEINVFDGTMRVEKVGEYGPETSSLFVSNNGQQSCYRLYRVGGDLEKEIRLFSSYGKETVSFPSGRYLLRIAEGSEWLSDEEAFGPDGKYSMIYYFNYEPGEKYHITTSSQTGSGTVHGDSMAGFTGG